MSKFEKRLRNILKSIDDIELILSSKDLKVTKALEDALIKPAIRMHIVKIAEQFSKLKDENEFEILEKFDKKDLKGLSAVRNYIAHDYDSTDDLIIEDVIRYNFPILKSIILEILNS